MERIDLEETLRRANLANPNFDNEVEILGLYYKGKQSLVRLRYGICTIDRARIMIGKVPKIDSALDKNAFYINKAVAARGDFYDYSKVDYTGSENDILIVCPTHGEFSQNASGHLKGNDCPKCVANRLSLERRDTKEEFVKKAVEVHGKKYSYKDVEYINQQTYVSIVCPSHGSFLQKPNSHISGKNGCPECAVALQGWSDSDWEEMGLKSSYFAGFSLYVLECWNEEERFFKIGKTFRNIGERFHAKVLMPYEYKVLMQETGSAKYISDLERRVHEAHREFSYKPKTDFGGQFECFSKWFKPNISY